MPDRNKEDRARLGEQTSRRNNRSVESEEMSARPNQVENEEDLTAGDEGIDDVTEFSGRGGQKDGSARKERERQNLRGKDRDIDRTNM